MLTSKHALVALLGCLPLATPLSLWSGQDGASLNALSFDSYPSPELGAFVHQVVESNPRLMAARSGMDAKQALHSAAAQPLYNPELELDYENATDRTWQAGVGLRLDWSGKREARSELAASDRDVSAAEYQAMKQELAIELLSGLVRYQTETQRQALAQERSGLMNEFAALAEQRFESGDLNQSETELARLALLDAKIRQATVTAQLAESRQSVWNIAQDTLPSQWPGLGPGIDSRPPALQAGPEAESLIRQLPELQAAQDRVVAADAAIELRKREQKPDPMISLRGGREDDDSLLGASFSVPLYWRNSYRFETSAAVAQRDQAQQWADDLSRRAYYRYLGATERYQLSQAAWQDWLQTGLASLQQQVSLVRRLWEAGELGTTEYLVQLSQTLEIRENALDLELAMWQSWLEWLAASGQVDNWLGQGGRS